MIADFWESRDGDARLKSSRDIETSPSSSYPILASSYSNILRGIPLRSAYMMRMSMYELAREVEKSVGPSIGGGGERIRKRDFALKDDNAVILRQDEECICAYIQG